MQEKENLTPEKENVYDESQIQVLEGLEAVRKRPGMYIGSTSSSGLHHLVYEIVDNSIDEALAGYCDKIEVIINPGNSITVTDNGRGIPAGMHPKEGIPTPEVVYTILHAGGKFGGGGYKIAGGLHGVGASVVNALSEWVELDDAVDGLHYTERFERGHVARPFKCEGESPDRPHGVKVTFKPDPTIFEETVFDYLTVLNRLREQAFLNAGIRIMLIDARGEEKKESDLVFEGGIRNFVSFLNDQKHSDLVHEEVIYMRGEKGTSQAEIALQYNTSYNETILTFANNMNTIEGGTHETGFKAALTRVLNDYARKNGFNRVSLVTKANVIKTTDGNFLEDCHKVGDLYPDIVTDEWYADIMTAKLVDKKRRRDFKVLLLPNLYGDIISDEAAEFQGGVGTAGCANIGKKYAMFEAIHGSAPRMVNEGRAIYADPCSMLRASVMLPTF